MESPILTIWKRLAMVVAVLLFVGILMVPIRLRLAHPSVYADDVARIGDLQEDRPLGRYLFTPFNEHMAPLFQGVSVTTWNLSHHSITLAPLAFTMASLVPHILALIVLGVLLRRETDSNTMALVGVAMQGLSALITETFSWYSASSFSWAMLGTLVAIDAAGRASNALGRARHLWLFVAAMSAFLAPGFCAIGLLAGPLAMLRLGWRFRAVVPLIGTVCYLAVCLPLRYGSLVSRSLERNLDLAATLRNVACTPVDVLLPGLIGRPDGSLLPDFLAMAISAVLLISGLVWAWRDRNARSNVLVGLGLIVGGYLLAFGARSADAPAGLRQVQRYQLFPQLGFVLLASLGLSRLLKRFDRSSLQTWSVGWMAAAMLLVVQLGPIREHAKFYRWPDQARTLEAIERLAETCRREGITRSQCLAFLDPIRNRWFDFEFNALMLMPKTVPGSRVADSEVRSKLLDSIKTADREYLFGGMDVSPYLVNTEPLAKTSESGRFVSAFEMKAARSSEVWDASGWASYLEYEFTPDRSKSSALALSVSGPVELWWSSDGRSWSEARSIRWKVARSGELVDRAIPLHAIPHWNGSNVRRVRIAPREAGSIAVGVPRLLR